MVILGLVLCAVLFLGGREGAERPTEKAVEPPGEVDLLAELLAAADELKQTQGKGLEEAEGFPQDRGKKQRSESGGRVLTASELYERASPAVVTVTAEVEGEGTVIPEGTGMIGTGSGFFVRPEMIGPRYADWQFLRRSAEDKGEAVGFVLTNYHVIRAAARVNIELADGRKCIYVWQVVAEDEKADLAVLCVVVESPKPLPALDISSSAPPPIGTTVYAIGNPKGLANSLSTGIVSGEREVRSDLHWLQTTAPISEGSSGGPLLTADGQVVGVTTASVVGGQNLNFAVPASAVRRLLNGPLSSREVWKGASVDHEAVRAYMDAEAVLRHGKGMAKSTAEKAAKAADTRSFRQLELLVKGQELLAQKRYAQGAQVLEEATRELPGKFEYLVYHTLGCAHEEAWVSAGMEQRSQMIGKATAAFERATALNRDFAPAYSHLCFFHSLPMAKRAAEGLAAAENLVRLVPRSWSVYETRGDFYSDLDQYVAALKDFKMAVELNPRAASAHVRLGSTYSHLGEHDQAIRAIQEAIRLESREGIRAMYYSNLGWAYKRQKEYAKAVEAYRTSLELAPGDNFMTQHTKREIAECLSKMGER
ncbi:MAG TPA: trypsin-like peptidase domain-containing protein [Planctomycetota bacterium]|nr:trypsin-like peptidase domain-containing protein [Planctomycetota bacterium]